MKSNSRVYKNAHTTMQNLWYLKRINFECVAKAGAYSLSHA